MDPLDENQLGDVTGGGVVGKVMSFGGKAWPWVDVVTSVWDGGWGYYSAREAGQSRLEATGTAAKTFVRSISMYDVWKNYCGTAY